VPWFRVDDKFHGSPKSLAAGKSAIGVWSLIGSWCMDQLTDGHVPLGIVLRMGGTKADATRLVKADLWHGIGHGCEDCPQPKPGYDYVFHDWFECNPSAADIRADREQTKARVKAWRERKKATGGNDNVTALHQR
jgi:hypothetical protein